MRTVWLMATILDGLHSKAISPPQYDLFVPGMRQRLLVIILGASVLCAINSSLLNFKVMIQRITQKNALIYFNGYGCYCGKGGRGKPRDETDMCCYNHDCCYEGLHNQSCHPYIDHYRYLMINNDVFCEYRNRSVCAMLACECDRQASLCFRKRAKTYNKKLRRYPAVLCKEPTPKCSHDSKPPDRWANKPTTKPLNAPSGSKEEKNPGITLQLKRHFA
ncbi:basic phospholipase A2 PLA-B-like [Elgaria multicarinata webbii]|uniref:basic phospholipase A2 PLA-B-like n=1 Tax=Elgaria multicarinata webbii TaxID=159646 RepID=UPI002FCD66D1